MEGEEDRRKVSPLPKAEETPGKGGLSSGWGSVWGLPSLSVLQKAAEGISRSAAAIARDAAEGIAGMHVDEVFDPKSGVGEADSSNGKKDLSDEAVDTEAPGEMSAGDDGDRLRKSALDKLEEASRDSIFSQGLKAIDTSMESLTSGAWNAFGFAWKEGSNLVHRLEHSATTLADSIQHGALPSKALPPSIIETSKSFTTKGIQALERVGKETMELLIAETGFAVEKDPGEVHQDSDEGQPEEVAFDRCFYIYGGPDHLEELEALSNHYALLYNRRKAKLLSEQKSLFDASLRQIQQILTLGVDGSENTVDSDKGKDIESPSDVIDAEMKNLLSSSVKKAADMAVGFTTTLNGLSADELVQRTSDRLESVRSEGVHRLAELCCFAVSHLLMLGKSIISSVTQSSSENSGNGDPKIDWPYDSISKATSVRSRARSTYVDVETITNCFLTGITDIIEAYSAALQKTTSVDLLPTNPVVSKAKEISDHLRADQTTALNKIGEALQYLAYVIVSSSMPTST